MMKSTKEHTVVPNLLNRQFKQDTFGKILLTDITYLNYSNRHRAYLSTIKDASTNEILAYNVSNSLKIDIVINTLDIWAENRELRIPRGAIIRSDQDVHYTSPIFQRKAKKLNLTQSMSRHGNCWDNVPQESFFGHFKDEVNLRNCSTIDDVKDKINSYMDYYNNYRYQ